MRRGARHNFGVARNPFRNPPPGSVLEAANTHVHPNNEHLADPLDVVADQIREDVKRYTYNELLAAPSITDERRRTVSLDHARAEAERFRYAMHGAASRRKPGRPSNDIFLCMIAVVQVKRCEREMPGCSRDALFLAAAKALGGGITKRQVRTAWCKVGRAAAACPSAHANDVLAEMFCIAEAALTATYSLPKSA